MNQVSEYPDTRTVDFIKTTDIPANKEKFNNPMKTARKSEQQYWKYGTSGNTTNSDNKDLQNCSQIQDG